MPAARNKTVDSTRPRRAVAGSPVDAYSRVAFARSPEAIVVATADGQIVDANPAATAMLGYGRDELLRLHGNDLVPPSPAWTEAAYAEFIRAGWWEGEVEVRTKQGARPFRVRVIVLPEDDGGLWVSFLHDLGEERRDEATRARLAALVTSSSDAIVGETVDGIITDWNPGAERLYGYTAAEMVGQSVMKLIPPEQQSDVAAMMARLLRGESIEEFETERWTNDGRRIDVAVTVSPVWNDARQIIGTSAIVRDISARKAAEAALAASEERFRVAFEDAPIGMVLSHPDGTTAQVNRAICQILGYTAPELIAITLRERTHPDDLPLTLANIQRAVAGEIAGFEQEKRYVRKDGRIVWALLSTTLVRDERGDPRYFISQIQDITQRKEAEAELAATHQRTREVLERITDGFYALDREWRFTYVNEAAERILGRDRDDLLGRSLWDVFPRAVETPVYTAFHKAIDKATTVGIEFQAAPGGKWYGVRAYPSPNGLSAFFRDVTAQRRYEREIQAALAEARAANRGKDLFLAMMSHELRTPLQAVLGYADFLLADRGEPLSPVQIEDIGYIRQGAERMAALIERILDLSRIEAGALDLASEPVDLPAILEQVRQDIAPQASAKELAVHVDVADRLPVIDGDPMRIRQILLNLAGNAVKFTEQGSVRLSARASGDGVDVSVSDTGIGIAREALPYIFEEFRQADNGAVRRYEGAGLGLAISRRLAEQMGGSISVVSQSGEGSTFTLHLGRAGGGGPPPPPPTRDYL